MGDFFNKRKLQLLNFDDGRREEWERKRYPYSALVELTSKCNFNCIHCYLHDHHCDSEMPYEKVIEILDILCDKGVLFLTLSGGEIFTRKDFMDIYLYAKKKGFMVELFTNGSIVDDEIIRVFCEYPPVNIDVTLYGSNEATYNKVTKRNNMFKLVVDNCKKLKRANIRVSIRTPVLNCTIDELTNMRKMAEEIGVVFATSYEITPTIDGDTSCKKYQVSVREMLSMEVEGYFDSDATRDFSPPGIGDGKQYPIFSCNVGRGALVIDYEGKMFPCMKLRHIGEPVLKENFDDLWASYDQYYRLLSGAENKCNYCDARFYCEVCPAEMHKLYGDYEYRTSMDCKIAKFRKSLHEDDITKDQAYKILNDLFDGL